jgi:hypothetical protein
MTGQTIFVDLTDKIVLHDLHAWFNEAAKLRKPRAPAHFIAQFQGVSPHFPLPGTRGRAFIGLKIEGNTHFKTGKSVFLGSVTALAAFHTNG